MLIPHTLLLDPLPGWCHCPTPTAQAVVADRVHGTAEELCDQCSSEPSHLSAFLSFLYLFVDMILLLSARPSCSVACSSTPSTTAALGFTIECYQHQTLSGFSSPSVGCDFPSAAARCGFSSCFQEMVLSHRQTHSSAAHLGVYPSPLLLLWPPVGFSQASADILPLWWIMGSCQSPLSPQCELEF